MPHRLRVAARTGDFERCRAALHGAFARARCDELVTVAEGLLARDLDAFERGHPGEIWPRRALAGAAGIPSPESPEPGGNSYLAAVESLLAARASRAVPGRCQAHLVDALAEWVMAGLLAEWGARQPREWERYYRAARAGQPLLADNPLERFWADPIVQAENVRRWEAVADALDAHLPGAA